VHHKLGWKGRGVMLSPERRVEGRVGTHLHEVGGDAVVHLKVPQVRVDLLRVVVAELGISLCQRVKVEGCRLDRHGLVDARRELLRLELLLLLQKLAIARRPLPSDAHVGGLLHRRDAPTRSLQTPQIGGSCTDERSRGGMGVAREGGADGTGRGAGVRCGGSCRFSPGSSRVAFGGCKVCPGGSADLLVSTAHRALVGDVVEGRPLGSCGCV
jgi:hypothetical protein